MTVAAHRFDNALRYGEADHPRQWHLTPTYVLAAVRQDLGGIIDLDPCTFADNPVNAESFYTALDDGLSKPWRWARTVGRVCPTIFVNPPYGKAREPWINHCLAAAEWGRVILLVPAATDTRIFQKAASTATAVVFVRGRVKFGTRRDNRRQHAASHPSALIGWNTNLEACSALGLRVVSNQESKP